MAAILNGRTVHVTDAVALFPRFPHLVEVGRIELPSAVVRYAPSGSSLSPPLFTDGLHPLGTQFII